MTKNANTDFNASKIEMNRIDAKFKELTESKLKGLFPFIVAGQPDLETTIELIKQLEKTGVSGIELGFPFTDPVADGPVIQSAFAETLTKGISVANIFEALANARTEISIPILAMVSASIVYKIGIDNFLDKAKSAGFDGFIIPDLSLEEAPVIAEKIAKRDLRLAMLVAPTSPEERQKKIAATATGFLYYMSVAGITGERDKLPDDLPKNVKHLKEISGLPVIVGFGIKTPEQVKLVCSVADGAIVGSAIVRRIADAQAQGKSTQEIINIVTSYTAELLTGTQ